MFTKLCLSFKERKMLGAKAKQSSFHRIDSMKCLWREASNICFGEVNKPKALNVCLVDTVLNAKGGCLQNFLKNLYGRSIKSLAQFKGRLPYHR